MDIREDLLKAADLIDRGWVQGMMCLYAGADDIRFCLLGAVNETIPGWEGRRRAFESILDAMPDGWYRGVGTQSLMLWNDDPSRTQGEVSALLRRAAEGAVAQ